MDFDAPPKCARASPSFLLCADALPPPEHFLLPAYDSSSRESFQYRRPRRCTLHGWHVTAPAAGAYGAPANSNGADLVITKRDATGAIPSGNTAVDIVFPYGKNV